MLCSGVWMQVEMHKYLVLNGEYSDVAPYILVATGSLILLISSLACCCTVKGHPTLLYLVNWIKDNVAPNTRLINIYCLHSMGDF